MRSPGEIWRQRVWIWVPALLFFLANAGAFAVYKLGYAGRIETLQETLQRQAETVKDIQSKRKQMYIDMQNIVMDELPANILFFPRSLVAVNKRVHNLRPNAIFTRWNTETWWVDDGK